MSLAHQCPDGVTHTLARDPAAPVGVYADHSCDRCGQAWDGPTLLAEVRAVLDRIKAGAIRL